MQSDDPQQPQNRLYSSWVDIAKALEEFKPPEETIDDEGAAAQPAWVFRGLKCACYELEPAIEREARAGMNWSALELRVGSEFKSRAGMHFTVRSVPPDDFSLLALMQHYAVPTRLLDFTYSPFVALYFAVSPGKEKQCACNVRRRVWAIDAEAVKRRFLAVAKQVEREEHERGGRSINHRVSSAPADARTDRDSMTTVIDEFQNRIDKLLPFPRECRETLFERGCVCAATPRTFNQRIASQQGVFLFNCVQSLTFRESLFKMMGSGSDWYRTFDIAASAISEIETRLFQMNIHEQSLFPDTEGLAGLIRQKLRLHWK